MTFHRSGRLALAGGTLLVALAMAVPVLAATVAVSIQDKTFAPAEIVVAQGDTVTWTVTKSINEPHTVTSGTSGGADVGKEFDSGIDNSSKLKDNGGTFSFTFEKAGTFAYFCQIHADMKGTVTVLASGEAPGESEAGIPMERRLIGAGILTVTLIVLFAATVVWRRVNKA